MDIEVVVGSVVVAGVVVVEAGVDVVLVVVQGVGGVQGLHAAPEKTNSSNTRQKPNS